MTKSKDTSLKKWIKKIIPSRLIKSGRGSNVVVITEQQKIIDENFPKILPNTPIGEDLFESKAHQKIVNTIMTLIESQSNTIQKQIIGLEGDWGTGKSNIIKTLEKQNSINFLHFTYDTWTHQEDLTRKSILQELIEFLKSTKPQIIDPKDTVWNRKENALSQKTVTKNSEYLPSVKAYYILIIVSFVVIKFGNETYKELLGNKPIGFFENSIKYLFEEFYISPSSSLNWVYFLKATPYLLLICAAISFVFSYSKEFKMNRKKEDAKRLSFFELLGKQFYWISGEKLQSSSTETLHESEPSNQKFRKFLKEIDNELSIKKKKLIFTIDNTDRLSDTKLKSIWSTINIFFAESNFDNLENIWLIIPYDEKKISSAMMEDGNGLLEKTFAITFKVPPALLSNWETLFENNFNIAFKGIELPEKEDELQLIKRIFETYEKEITPRKTINFINQLTSYYIQNKEIKLRYDAIFILNKESLLIGNINDKIINRNEYLKSLRTIFLSDDTLELNLIKIIYGLSDNKSAEEALLITPIEDILKNKRKLSEDIIKTRSFRVYFEKVFNYVITDYRNTNNAEVFESITSILVQVQPLYMKEKATANYNGLWQFYSEMLFESKFDVLSETLKNVLKTCSNANCIKIVNRSIEYLSTKSEELLQDENVDDKRYIKFLEDLDNYLESQKKYKLANFKIIPTSIDTQLFLDYLTEKKDLVSKFKLQTDNLSGFFKIKDDRKEFCDATLLIKYRNEILSLKNYYDLKFINNDIADNWLNKSYFNIEEVETLMFFYNNLSSDTDPININELEIGSYQSLIVLASQHFKYHEELYILLLLNYEFKYLSSLEGQFVKVLSNSNLQTLALLKNAIQKYGIQNFSNIVKIPFELRNRKIDLVNALTHFVLSNEEIIDEDIFLWIMTNYSSIIEFHTETNIKLINKAIKKAAEVYDIEMSTIDIELITDGKLRMTKKLCSLANKYLLESVDLSLIWLSPNKQEYQLLEQILYCKQMTKPLIMELFVPLKRLALNNSTITRDQFKTINLYKKLLNQKIIEDAIKELVSRYIVPRGIVVFIPEIFSNLPELPNKRAQIMEIIISQRELYTNSLVDFALLHPLEAWQKKFIRNLDGQQDSEVYKYAKAKKLIPAKQTQ